jgi:hypothetical protein
VVAARTGWSLTALNTDGFSGALAAGSSRAGSLADSSFHNAMTNLLFQIRVSTSLEVAESKYTATKGVSNFTTICRDMPTGILDRTAAGCVPLLQ